MYSKKSFFNRINSGGNSFVLIFLALIFLWILARPLRGIGEGIYFWSGRFLNSFVQSFSEAKSNINNILVANNTAIKQKRKISNLIVRNIYLENKYSEIVELSKLLELKSIFNYRTIASKVIGRTADNWHKQIILDKGLSDGIKQGNAVLTDRGLVGQVIELDKNSSIVELVSDPGFKVGCKILNKNILGITTGLNNKIAIVKYIPIDAEIAIGDLVVTSGISVKNSHPTYPQGYPIGRISKVSKNNQHGSDLYLEVRLFENLNSLNNVLVFSPQ